MMTETRIIRLGEDGHPILFAAIERLLGLGPANRSHLAAALADPDCYFIVCVLDSDPVGYLSAYRFPAVYRDGFQVYLYDITVHENHRRRGLATGMIEDLKARCVEDGVTRIWVGTSLDNLAAQRTFEGTGARRESETYVEFVYPMKPPNRTGAG